MKNLHLLILLFSFMMSSSYAAVTLDDINNTRKSNEDRAFYQAKNDQNLIYNYYKNDSNFWLKINDRLRLGFDIFSHEFDNYLTDDLFRHYLSIVGYYNEITGLPIEKSKWIDDAEEFIQSSKYVTSMHYYDIQSERSWYQPKIKDYEETFCDTKFGCIKVVVFDDKPDAILPID